MKYFYIIGFILVTINCFSQTISEIKQSENYYWGEGKANSLEQADKNALKDLISQISVQIESTMKNIWTEGNGTYKEFTESVTKTYSGATLDRAERKVEESETGVKVIRYITKQKMEEIFSDRKNKIYDYIKTAQNAEKELRIGDALKYYFWSLALLRSHPDCSKIKGIVSGNDEILLLTALPDKISTLLNSINVEINSISERENVKSVYLKVTQNNKSLQNYDFTYYTGDTWSSFNSTKNGNGLAELYGESARSLTDFRLRTEYVFRNNSKIDPDVFNVIENTNIPFFKNAELKIPLKADLSKKSFSTSNVLEKNTIESLNFKEPVIEYEKAIAKIKLSIQNKEYNSIKALFTDEGYKMFEKLINYGNAKLLPQDKPLTAIKNNNNIQVRSIPMSFSFSKNRQFIDEVSFSFNTEKKISSIAFSLGDKALNDVVSKSNAFATIENKYQLIQFMEDYKTAYCLGNIDYLNKVFADNALIIVGHVLKEENKQIDKMYTSLGDEKVKYIKYSKKEYIEKLRATFKNNEFVNIQFDENIVKKVKVDDNVYGIQIAQNWYSANYADKGYLFLMFDLNDTKNPKIYVRTWQPDKNSDGSIYGISDFKF